MTGWFGLALWVAVLLLVVPSVGVRAQVADDRLPVLAAVEEARRLACAGSCERATARWEGLAEGGSAQSARWLGALFKEGCGDLESWHRLGMTLAAEGRFEEAARAFEHAAVRGYVLSQYNLGTLYDRGDGVVEDAGWKAYWWRRAALGGSGPARRHLGVMYANGEYFGRDLARAHAWLSLSPGAEARRLLGELGPYLSAADRRQAERLRTSLVAPAP